MKMEKIRRQLRLSGSKEGVSTLAGEMMVLVITVILFAGIFTFVYTLKGPQDDVYTNFHHDGTTYVSSGSYREISVTNNGGQDLWDSTTRIYLFVNGTLTDGELYVHSSKTPLGTAWQVGETWTYDLPVTSEFDTVRMTVTDIGTNAVVWDEFLTGEPDASPVIGFKGTNPSPAIITDFANFYCDVFDQNNDIQSVYVDLTRIDDRMAGDDYVILTLSSGTETRWVSSGVTVTAGWDGAWVTYVAVDKAGHIATSMLQLTAEPKEGVETGDFLRNIIYSKNDGFNIFNKAYWDLYNFDAEPSYIFDISKSEDAAVVVVSKTLLNLDSKNHLEVLKVTDKSVVYSSNTAFKPYKYTNGFYVYVSTLDIVNPTFVANERYLVKVFLEDNSYPSNSISVEKEISTVNGGTYPVMQTYKNRTDTKVTTNFWNNEIIEVKVICNSFDGGATYYPLGGDVILTDFVGGTQLHFTPPTPSSPTSYYWKGGAVSNVVKVNATTYVFAINLTAAKAGDAWVSGRNQAYILSFDMFMLQNTTQVPTKYYHYLLSTIVYISSPTFTSGIATALVEGVSPSNGGAGQYYEGNEDWIQSSSMIYYKNDNSWIPPILIDKDFWNAHRPQTLLCASGDLNGDGTVREVISYYASTSPHNYQTDNNFANTNDVTSWSRINLNVFNGETWAVTQLKALNTGTEVKSLIMANIDQDSDLDVIFGMKNGTVVIGRNNGDNPATWDWRYVIIGGTASTTRSVVAMVAANLSPSAKESNITRGASIIVGCNDGTVYVFRNLDGFGNWNNPWATLLTLGKVKQLSINSFSGSRVSSMSLGDMDHDGSWDLVLLRTTSSAGQLVISYNNDLNLATPTSNQIFTNNANLDDKSNLTIGRYCGKDMYPDIAVMIPDKGIFFINHTFSIALGHTYTLITPATLNYLAFNTPATTTRVALLSCMITGDLDGDGLDDLVLGTMRNPWGEVIGGVTYYNRMSKGAVFVLINGNASPSGWQDYLVDDPGTPIRAFALV